MKTSKRGQVPSCSDHRPFYSSCRRTSRRALSWVSLGYEGKLRQTFQTWGIHSLRTEKREYHMKPTKTCAALSVLCLREAEGQSGEN